MLGPSAAPRRGLGVVRAAAIASILTLLAGFAPARAQDPPQRADVLVYHGSSSSSGPVNLKLPEHPIERLIAPPGTIYLSEGSQLCVRVLNPHPAFYSYALNRAVDSTPVVLPPGVSVLTDVLNGALGTTKAAAALDKSYARGLFQAPGAGRMQGRPLWLVSVADALATLGAQLDSAGAAIVQSQQPEELRFEGNPSVATIPRGQPRGFDHAVARIHALGHDDLEFNDPKLAENWRRLIAAAKGSVSPDSRSADEALLDILDRYGATLIDARNAVRKVYGRPAAVQIECATVGRGITTVKLAVTRRDTAVAAVRDTAAALASFTVRSLFPRPTVELLTTAFAIGARVPQFSIDDSGRVQEDRSSAVVFRPGAMLLYNPLVWGRDRSAALGVSLGFGLLGDKVGLSDFLGGLVLSYRDLLRIGAGGGWARLPNSLKSPATVGQPLPAGIGKIDDIVEQRSRGAVYLMFSIAGMTLPSLK